MISGISFADPASGSVGQVSIASAGVRQDNDAKQSGVSEFGDLFRGSVGKIEELDREAQAAVEGLMRGTGVDIHEAMIAAQKANAAFELALSLRNKAIQSYQSIMGMQF